jgi:hypothetical protein
MYASSPFSSSSQPKRALSILFIIVVNATFLWRHESVGGFLKMVNAITFIGIVNKEI